jgi:hypothetical protein
LVIELAEREPGIAAHAFVGITGGGPAQLAKLISGEAIEHREAVLAFVQEVAVECAPRWLV